MKPLYLTRLRLEQFRSFGTLDVGLPDGPGVLIVHGSNGLGKSSLFDALEWGLTGEVNHMPTGKSIKKADYLRRWDAPARHPTKIVLDFNEGKLVRSLSRGLDPAGEQDIATFLKSERWTKPIRHLERYLFLTHFLGQSTMSRMTHRGDKDRWKYLQEPAQSDRALDLVRTIHGHGGSNAAKAFDRKLDQLAKQADVIARLLDQEEDYWLNSQLEGAIDDTVAPTEAAAIAGEIEAIRAAAGVAVGDAVRLTLADAPRMLAAYHALTADALRRRESGFSRAQQLLAEKQAADIVRAELRGALTEARQQEAFTVPQLSETAESLVEAENKRVSAQQEVDDARAAVATLSRYADMRSRHVAARQAVEQAQALSASLREHLQAAAARAERAQKRRTLADWLMSRERSAAEDIRRFNQRREELDEARTALAAMVEAQRLLDEQLERSPTVGADVGETTAKLEVVRRSEGNVRVARDAVKTSADALAAAVAGVAAHVGADACQCPLCGTDFEAGQLQARVRAVADRLAPALAPLEAQLADVIRERELVEQRLTSLIESKSQLDDALTEFSQRSTVFNSACANLGVAGADSDAHFAALIFVNDRALSFAEFRRQRARYWVRHRVVGGAENALAEWTDAAAKANELQRHLATQERAVTEATTALGLAWTNLADAAAAADLAADADAPTVDARKSRLAERERAAAAANVAARAAFESADAAHRSARSAHASVTTRIEELTRQEAARTEEAEVRRNSWEKLSVGLAPYDGKGLGRMIGVLTALAPDLARAQDRVEAFQRGRIIAARLARHAEVFADLRKLAESAPAADRDLVRASAMSKQAALLDRAARVQKARDIAREATQEVGQRVEAFNQRFLEPLSKLMNNFNRAILTDRNIGLDFLAGKNIVGQRTKMSDVTPAHIAKLDPLYIHSEGQMAALAVSMLAAANLSYPWSRWRALVMDDPLQHNDAIHAAAFADMIRNLVIERGYQIFLTTHELAEAQFLRRKFQAADITCTMLHLTGRGRDGVESRVEMPAPLRFEAG